jgi:hypothetical protein
LYRPNAASRSEKRGGPYNKIRNRNDGGGVCLAHWIGTRETEDWIAAETKETIR